MFINSTPPTKEGPAIVKVAKSKHEGNIACNEAKCVAFMLYGNRYWWKASLQDMTGKQIANAAEKNEHHVRCPNICRNEMIIVERLGALIIHSSSKQEYTVRAAPQILCSLNLSTLWLFLIHIYICIIDMSKPLTFWFFDMFWFCLSWNYCDCRSWNLFWWFWLMCFKKWKLRKQN